MTVVNRDNYKPMTCFDQNKRRFFDAEEAQAAADKMAAKRGHDMFIYQCGRHWHLTSKSKQNARVS